MSATAQGRGSREPAGRGATAPIGVPHRWQNLAPGDSDALQAPQVAPLSDAPQLAQNCPAAEAPQAGQVVVETGKGMPESYMTGLRPARRSPRQAAECLPPGSEIFSIVRSALLSLA